MTRQRTASTVGRRTGASKKNFQFNNNAPPVPPALSSSYLIRSIANAQISGTSSTSRTSQLTGYQSSCSYSALPPLGDCFLGPIRDAVVPWIICSLDLILVARKMLAWCRSALVLLVLKPAASGQLPSPCYFGMFLSFLESLDPWCWASGHR